MAKRLAAIILALFVAAAGYWYYAPQMTIDKIRTALVTKDKALLEEAVDFEKLRKNIKEQLKADLAQEMMDADAQENPFAALGLAFATKFLDPLIDGLVNPDTILKNLDKNETKAKIEKIDVEFTDREMDRVYGVVIDDEEGQKLRITLERYGITYRLTDIELPKGSSKQLKKLKR